MNSKAKCALILGTILCAVSFSLGSAELQGIYCVDMAEHRKKCVEEIISQEKRNRLYPLSRVLLSVSGDDTDTIPKVPHAGKIYNENGIAYQLMHNGVKIIKDCYYDSWITDIIYALKGHHEPQEERAFYEVLQYIPQNATMIELGAYWGYYSLWFSQAIKEAKNYLVEPDSNCIEAGKKNFELNKKKGFFYQGYIELNKNDGVIFNNAKKISIDSFLKEEQIQHVNILHSDIQGAEYEMLKSCKNAMRAGEIDYFFISTHSPGIHNNCLLLLRAFNYTIIAEHGMHESCSIDGLIVARRKNIAGLEYIPLKKYAP